MPSPPYLVHPMENSSATDSASARPTKFTYASTVTVSKTVAAALAAAFVLLLLLAIIGPIVVYLLTKCTTTSGGDRFMITSTVYPGSSLQSPEPRIGDNVNYRLPRDLVPLNYTVHLKAYIPSNYVQYDSRSDFTFDGNISILVLCNYTTNVFILHSKRLNITKDSLRIFELDDFDKNYQKIDIISNGIEEVEHLEQIRIPLKFNLTASKRYRLYANYRGELSSELTGFYRSSYDENNVTKWLAVTQFQPTSARRALPCFDEPEFKAVFSVRLTNPRNMIALSNAMDYKRDDALDGWSTTYFKPSPKMSSYLLAFIISEFAYKSSQTDKGVTFRIWARPSQIENAGLALDVGPKILELFESYFSIPFPLEKQDMVAIPDFDAGAMENWGLITYRETYLLATKNSSSSTIRQRLVEVMAHELAHQWFGNLVTMQWWDDIWLNEGFSMYMQYMCTDQVMSRAFKMSEQFIINSLHLAMETDQMTTSHPLHVEVNNPTEIFQIFDAITYDKGASVIRMLRNVVGEQVFQRALSQYLTEFKYSNANHYDLWDSLTKVVQTDLSARDWNNRPLNVTEFMMCWTEQMGYPLVWAERDYQARTISFNQSRFKIDENAPDNPKFRNNTFGYNWYIPIKYQIGSSPNVETAWIVPGQDLTLPQMLDSNTWILINHGVTGYYRTNYDDVNWQLLRNQLLTNNRLIDTRNRAQLVEDAFTLAKVGKLKYSIALSLTEYMPNEDAYVVWGAGLSNFKWIKERLMQLEKGKALLENYYRTLIAPVYHRVGYERIDQVTDEAVTHKLRALIWQYACEFALPHCIDSVKTLFREYRLNCTGDMYKSSSDCNKLSPNLRQIIYCHGIAESETPDDWNFLWRKYLLEDFSVEKLSILYGLSCSKNPAMIKRFLDNAAQGQGIRTADAGVSFIMVSQNPTGVNMLWNYVSNNWNNFVTKFDLSHSLSAIVKAATVGFSTPEQLNKMITFMEQNANNLGSSRLAFDQRLEETKTNIVWMENYSNEVINWFRQHTTVFE